MRRVYLHATPIGPLSLWLSIFFHVNYFDERKRPFISPMRSIRLGWERCATHRITSIARIRWNDSLPTFFVIALSVFESMKTWNWASGANSKVNDLEMRGADSLKVCSDNPEFLVSTYTCVDIVYIACVMWQTNPFNRTIPSCGKSNCNNGGFIIIFLSI